MGLTSPILNRPTRLTSRIERTNEWPESTHNTTTERVRMGQIDGVRKPTLALNWTVNHTQPRTGL